jgi:Lon protease-like protein
MQPNPLIPIFPLPLVALPGETVPLHIFEERYQEMIAFCRAAKANGKFHGFGIVQEQENRVFEVGCVVEINAVIREYGDGRLDIVTVGTQRFKVEEIFDEQSYYTARVGFFEDKGEPVDPKIKAAVAQTYQRLIDLMGQYGRPVDRVSQNDAEPEAFQLGGELGLELSLKQRLLEMDSETERLEVLNEHMNQLVPALEAQLEKRRQTTQQRKKVEGNGHLNGDLN